MPNIIIGRRTGRKKSVASTPYGNAWSAQVVANGGALPSLNSVNTVDAFMAGITADGVISQIITANLIAPDSLIAAMTPVIAAGTQPWTNTGFVLTDLSVNGLHPVGGQYMNPGVISGASAMTTTSQSLCFYDYNANVNGAGTEIAAIEGGNGSFFVSNLLAGGINCDSDLTGAGCRINVANPGNGFYLASRIASNDGKIYFANSGTAFASIGSTAAASAALLPSIGYLVCATNNNGSVIQGMQGNISFAMIGKGLTAAQGQALYNRVQAARVSFGGGYR